MWPCKKRAKYSDRMIAIRYTRDASKVLFPGMTDEEWDIINKPSDLGGFIRSALLKSKTVKNRIAKSVLVATIDDEYLEWLQKNKKIHSKKTISIYIKQRLEDNDFWNSKLRDSGMTTTYNVLGIPSMLIPHCYNGYTSSYCLSADTTLKVTDLLKQIYKSEKVFVPSWIIKGCDMPSCVSDIIYLSEVFWSDGSRVRLGKFLEQKYEEAELADMFSAIYFVVPFVVKSTVSSAIIGLEEIELIGPPTTEKVMSTIRWPEHQRCDLFNLIANDVPQIISIGTNAVSPECACIFYEASSLKRMVAKIGRSTY